MRWPSALDPAQRTVVIAEQAAKSARRRRRRRGERRRWRLSWKNHDLPLCKLNRSRVGSTSDQTAAGTAAYGVRRCRVCAISQVRLEASRRWGRTRAEIDEQLRLARGGAADSVLARSVLYEVMSLREHFEQAVEILADVVLVGLPDGRRGSCGASCWPIWMSCATTTVDFHRFFGRELYGDTPTVVQSRAPKSTMALSLPAAKAWHSHHTCAATWWLGPPGRFLGPKQNRSCSATFRRCRTDHAAMNRFPRRARQGRKVLIVDKPERTQSQILIGQLAPLRKDPSWLPLHVSTMAFGGTFTARLMDEVRAKRGLSYGDVGAAAAGAASVRCMRTSSHRQNRPPKRD